MLILLFVGIGWVLGTYLLGSMYLGMVIFLGLAIALNSISYLFGDKIILAAYRAKVVEEHQAPKLYRTVKRVSQMGDIPMPRVAIIPTETPNAFATGRNPKRATVAVTEGLMKLMDDEQLEGVIAHEISHVSNRDILVMTMAATVAGAIAFAARWALFSAMFGRRSDGGGWLLLLVAITAPIAAILIQLAISRTREYKADASGALITGKPYALASALEKLEKGNRRRPMRGGNPASQCLFIVNPFRGVALASLFMTHPPIEERVSRLKAM
jgi:heat shock protein HtpX